MPWSLHNLFPICPVPHCPKYNTRHMLDHQSEIANQILQGNENYIYWQGGVGSAKTMLYAGIVAAMMIMIPGVRCILFRKDYILNYETLWLYFRQAIQAALQQNIIQGNPKHIWSRKKQGDYSYCELPNGSTARAGQTKSWSEFMGPTYDVIAVSDAMENNNFGEIFRGEGVVGGLQSRIRGQPSTFFKLPNGTYKDMRRFLIETNPPPNINELHTLFGREPGVRNLTTTCDPVTGKHITYRHIQTTSAQNDHNPASYVAEITATHSNPDDIKRILEGKTVPYYGGIRVIETFYQEIHVTSAKPDNDLPLFISIDPGYQHPGVTFSQIKRCKLDKEHYITLSEISNLFNKTTWELAEFNSQDILGILPHLALFYPKFFNYTTYTQIRDHLLRNTNESERLNYIILEEHFNRVKFCIDKAGENKTRLNKDAKSDRIILLTEYGIRCKVKTNIGVDKSLDRVRELHKITCECGIPRRLINKDCALLIDAYSGGYRYTKNRDGSHSDKPIDDHLYEDIADADRYSLENFYWSSNEDSVLPIREKWEENYPWSWMEKGIR